MSDETRNILEQQQIPFNTAAHDAAHHQGLRNTKVSGSDITTQASDADTAYIELMGRAEGTRDELDFHSGGSHTRLVATGGGVQVGATTTGKVAFWGSTPVQQQAVTGARDDPTEALKNLLSVLDTLGLIDDQTTAS